MLLIPIRRFGVRSILLFCLGLLFADAAAAQFQSINFAPTITSFLPASGPIGTSVTITGTNFNSTETNNIVYMGVARATVTAASPTSLTVTVPVGANFQLITVTNTATNLTGYSDKPFIVTFTSTGVLSFATRVDFATGTSPFGLTVADFDGDGKTDVAVVNRNANSVSLFRNGSSVFTASLAAKTDITVGSNPFMVTAGDIDGDGKPDLVISNFGANTISLLRNTSVSGTISFAARIDIASGTNPIGLALGDLDYDGKPDLVAVNNGSASISVFRNTSVSGTISFAAKNDIALGNGPTSVCIADLDRDGKRDVAVTVNNAPGGPTVVLLNASVSGTIILQTPVTTGLNISDVQAADIDGDSKPDLLGLSPIQTIRVHRNLSSPGTVSFAAFVDRSTGNSPVSHAIGDIDGDGLPDFAATSYSGQYLSAFRNTSVSGTISFNAKTDFTTANNPSGIAMADMDGDGRPDLVVANNFTSTVSVFLNTTPPPAPLISSFSPASGPVGTAVTITGNNFNTIAANNLVYFGDTKATVTVATTTSLTVTVPPGASYKNISITNTTGGFTAYSLKPFVVTFTNSGTRGLTPKADIVTGARPQDIVTGDIDGDGKTDMVVVTTEGNAVSVYRNTSATATTSFTAKQDIISGTAPVGCTLGDVNGDGKPDLIVNNWGNATISVFRNTSTPGTISFAAKIDYATSLPALGGSLFYVSHNTISVADIDGDGRPEIIAITNGFDVYRNTSTGGAVSFAAKTNFGAFNSISNMAVGDIDGDGKPDIVFAQYPQNAGIGTYRNTSSLGSISFGTKTDLFGGGNFSSIALGDIDGDGKADLVVGSLISFNLTVSRNTSVSGTISFAALTDLSNGVFVGALALSDMDGDGKTDITTANYYDHSLSFYRNTSGSGAISFAANIDNSTVSGSFGIASADIDGDGRIDLVTANDSANTVSVLRNVILPPVVNSFTPAAGAIGSTVTITGNYFNTTAANNLVLFGDTKATVTAATATSLTVTVPVAASYKNIMVTNIGTGLSAYAAKPFDVTFAINGSLGFSGGTDLSAGAQPFDVASADIDGDGKTDLVITNNAANTVSVLRNTSTGGVASFAAKVDLTTKTGKALHVALGDLDGDGKPDLAVTAGDHTDGFSVFRNLSTSGNISFGTRTDIFIAANTYPDGVVIGDIDLDGRPDIVVGTLNGLSVIRNTSIGSLGFAAPVNAGSVMDARDIRILDFDGDGIPDIASANYQDAGLAIVRNLSIPGQLSFATVLKPALTASQPSASALVAVDMDGDGKPDLGLTTIYGGDFRYVLNTSTPGTLSFGPQTFLPVDDTYSGAGSVAAGDMDGDGKADLVVYHYRDSLISVLRNQSTPGTIKYSVLRQIKTPDQGGLLSVQDIDGDSKPDLAVAMTYLNKVTVYQSIDVLPPPVVVTDPANAAICAGNNTKLFVKATSALTYQWQSDNGSGFVNVTNSGVYSGATTDTLFITGATTAINGYKYRVVVTNAGGNTNSTAATLTVNALPAMAATTGASTVCINASITLSNSSSGTGVWTSANATIATVNTAGSVTGIAVGTTQIIYTVTNGSGCTNTIPFTITVNALPVFTLQSAVSSISKGATIQLTASAVAGATIAWTPAVSLDNTTSFTPVAKPLVNTNYTATVTITATGCAASRTLSITVIEDFNVTANKVVTHNGDGINDYFVFDNILAYPENTLQVFDKRGKLVFEARGYHNEWNGEVSGKPLANDTYFYVLKIKGELIKKGTVSIIH